jgi:radical SAM superfamily enzyme YgiQ (UPF0313 family)
MARADLSEREIMALRRAGCRILYFGLESGSDRVLSGINKGINATQMSKFIRMLHDHDITPVPSLFVGPPGENEVDFKNTIRFILDHRNFLRLLNLYPFMVTPSSDFSFTNQKPLNDTLSRLSTMLMVCVDIGIKACVGEQTGEYALFKHVYPGDSNYQLHSQG